MFTVGVADGSLEEPAPSPPEFPAPRQSGPARLLYWLACRRVSREVSEASLRSYAKLMVYTSCMMMGFILPMPLMIFAQTKFFNGGKDCIDVNQTASDGCKQAMSLVSQTSAATSGVNSVLSLWFSPVVGRLSDSVGRRLVLCLAIAPSLLQQLCLFLWAWTDGAVTLWLYYGLMCFPRFSMVSAAAYTADIIPAKHRATFFSFNSAMFSITNIYGSAIAGQIDRIEISSFIAACFQALGMAWAMFVMKETLPDSERKPFDHKNAREVRSICNFFEQVRIINRNAIFRRLALTLVCSSMCSMGLYQVQQMYFRQHLNFTKENFVAYSEIAGAGGMVVQVFITPVLIARAGEKATVVLGLSVYMVYMLLYATEVVNTPSKAYLNSLIQDISNVNYPAISSIKSTLCAGNEQGQVLGSLSAVQNLASGIGPFLFSGIFSVSLEKNATLPVSTMWCVGLSASLPLCLFVSLSAKAYLSLIQVGGTRNHGAGGDAGGDSAGPEDHAGAAGARNGAGKRTS